MKYHFLVGNDNGNSEHDIYVDGELMQQPNVNVLMDKLPWNNDKDTPVNILIKEIQDNIIVTVNSPSARPGIYYIGKKALSCGSTIDNMQVGVDDKSMSEIPIVNTLALIAVKAVENAFNEASELSEKIEISIDMATALPVTQYSEAAANRFKEKFMKGTHCITLHVGPNRVDISIRFEFVKIVPEGTPVIFALQSMEQDFYKEFNKLYNINIDGTYFCDKRVLHVDIGDGTTEYPVTEGSKFMKDFIDGSNNGAGHAIENSLSDFMREANLPEVTRQYMEEVLKGSDPYKAKYLSKAKKAISVQISNEARQILKKVVSQLQKIRNEIDIIAVYGGGSILMRDSLFDEIKRIADDREVKLLYVSPQYAVTLNAAGLEKFVSGDIYKALKERAVKTV